MKKNILLFFILWTMPILVYAEEANKLHIYKVPFTPPKLAILSENGSELLSSHKGKVILLNVWATWCAPCLKEMPSLDELAKIFPENKFKVLPVSQDKGGLPIVKPFYTKLDLKNIDIYVDPNGEVYRAFALRGLPSTFIISKEGKLIARLEGTADWTSADLVKFIRLEIDR